MSKDRMRYRYNREWRIDYIVSKIKESEYDTRENKEIIAEVLAGR